MSYLLDFSQGPRVFHSGDTALSSEHALYGTFYRPEVAMLGVGGAVIAGRQVDEMNPAEAAGRQNSILRDRRPCDDARTNQ